MDTAGFPNGSRFLPRIPLPLGSAYFFVPFKYSTIFSGSLDTSATINSTAAIEYVYDGCAYCLCI